MLIQGETELAKVCLQRFFTLRAKGLKPFEYVDCGEQDQELLKLSLWGKEGHSSKLESCLGGTIFFREINRLGLDDQRRLKQV